MESLEESSVERCQESSLSRCIGDRVPSPREMPTSISGLGPHSGRPHQDLAERSDQKPQPHPE